MLRTKAEANKEADDNEGAVEEDGLFSSSSPSTVPSSESISSESESPNFNKSSCTGRYFSKNASKSTPTISSKVVESLTDAEDKDGADAGAAEAEEVVFA